MENIHDGMCGFSTVHIRLCERGYVGELYILRIPTLAEVADQDEGMKRKKPEVETG